MAAGSQALKGSWALFVLVATRIKIITRLLGLTDVVVNTGKDKKGYTINPPKEIKIKPSPTRLDTPVKRPALRDLVLL